jgi:hypothetical protein
MHIRGRRFELEVSRPGLMVFVRLLRRDGSECLGMLLDGTVDGLSVMSRNGKAVWPAHMRDDYVPAAAPSTGRAFADMSDDERRGWMARNELERWRRHNVWWRRLLSGAWAKAPMPDVWERV